MDKEIFDIFIKETNAIINNIGQAIGELKIEPIYRLSHTLKGNAAQFGYPEISQKSSEIESLAKAINTGEKELTSENIYFFNKKIEELKGLCQAVKY